MAIPVSVVHNVAEQLIDKGRVDRGSLEIQYDLANIPNTPLGSAQVIEVIQNGAADRAGVKVRDVIIGIDGTEFSDYLVLRNIVGNKAPGDTVLLDILRGRKRIQIEVILGNTAGVICGDGANVSWFSEFRSKAGVGCKCSAGLVWVCALRLWGFWLMLCGYRSNSLVKRESPLAGDQAR